MYGSRYNAYRTGCDPKAFKINFVDQVAMLAALASIESSDEDPSEIKDDVVDLEIKSQMNALSSKQELDMAIEEMIQIAVRSGLPQTWADKLSTLIWQYRDVFRTKLIRHEVVAVKPMKVRLKTDARPVKCQARNYSKLHRDFLEEFTEEVVEAGCLYKNRESRWTSPAYVVPKPDTNGKRLRVTVDLRVPNRMVEPIQWPMPHLDTLLQFMSGCQYYITCDGFKGYWQLPLDKESQEIMSIMTHNGVFTPTRISQGAADSVMFFQSAMDTIFDEEKGKIVMTWVDDIIGAAGSFKRWFSALKFILNQSENFDLKLSAIKTTLFAKEVQWCGQIFNASGMKHDPERLSALASIPEPTTAAELQVYLGASNWMREALPDYARISKSFQEVLKFALKGKGSKKRVAKKAKIVFNEEAKKAFEKN